MRSSDILSEHSRCAGLRQSDLDSFAAEGVSAMALARSRDGDFLAVARDQVMFEAVDTRFGFARHLLDTIQEVQALNAYVVPLLDSVGDPVDLLAWRPGGPVATWLGRVSLCGEEQVLRPRFDQPLDVFETPLDWLRAGRKGTIVLDCERAAWHLRGASLRAASMEHARRLRIALTLPRPQIVVREILYNVQDKSEGRAA